MQAVQNNYVRIVSAAATCCVIGGRPAFSDTPGISLYFGEWHQDRTACSEVKEERHLDFELDSTGTEFVTFGSSKCVLDYSNLRNRFKVWKSKECLQSGFPQQLIGSYKVVTEGHLEFTNSRGEVEMFKDCGTHK
jgi:hypothetical protein